MSGCKLLALLLGLTSAHTCRSEALVLRMLGVEATYEILNVMEFSSARGRMSVIARAPDGAIRLYCKGSDAVILGLLRKDTSQDLLTNTHRSLHLFATQVRFSTQ